MPDVWDSIELEPTDVKQIYNQNPNPDAWDNLEQEESWGKSIVRYLSQIPAGIAQAFTWPVDLIKMMGVADINDPEEIQRLRDIAQREGLDPDEIESKYWQGAEQAENLFPTQGRIEQAIEEETGFPLEPKTRGQKALRFLGTAGKLAPSGSTLRPLNVKLPKPVLGAGITATKEGLQEAGLPEPISELASFGVLKRPTEGAPSLGFGKKTKPSGMPERRFESLKKPTEISAEKHAQITGKVKEDFKNILDEMVSESPIGETTKELAENPRYKSQIAEKFEKVEELSKNIPDVFPTKEIKNSIVDRLKKETTKGISPSEYESSYQKFMSSFISKMKAKNISAQDLVDQFRKNNQALGEMFESGKSGAYNRAKKDAYLDYNRSIADLIEKKFPKSEFSDLFKESNMQWSKIKDAEFIDSFFDDLFEGKINFKKGEKVFDKKSSEKFKKALGSTGYNKLQTLMDDLLSTKEGYSKLKVARDKGYENLARTGIAYVLHPKLAAAKVGKDILHRIYEASLDKPRFSLIWKEGIDAFKKGNFEKAQDKFSLLDKEISVK